jgi:hypothetical protein
LRKKLSVAIAGDRINFPEWLYGFKDGPDSGKDCPRLYKLHGSVNWEAASEDEVGVSVRQIDPMDPKAGYGGDPFLMMLPFWDKKIGEPPWDRIWKLAGQQLNRTTNLVVWGYCGFRGKAGGIPGLIRSAFRNQSGHDSGMNPGRDSDLNPVSFRRLSEP